MEENEFGIIDYNTKYIYHGTRFPLFLATKKTPKGVGWFSIRPDTAFAMRGTFGVPCIYKYKVIDGRIENLLDLDVGEEPNCVINSNKEGPKRVCDSGKFKGKSCSEKLGCPASWKGLSKYKSMIKNILEEEYYHRVNDGYAYQLCDETKYNGYVFTSYENQVVICDSDDILELKAVKMKKDSGWTDWITDRIIMAKTYFTLLDKDERKLYSFGTNNAVFNKSVFNAHVTILQTIKYLDPSEYETKITKIKQQINK